MRYTVEHYRVVDAPETPLGYDYVPTGLTVEVNAPDATEAAALALGDADDRDELDTVSYDPGRDLYGVAGEDGAVRVTPA